MNKFIRCIQNYLIYAFPFVLICMLWSSLRSEQLIMNGAHVLTKITWELLSRNLMLWFSVLIVFLVMLLAVPVAREKTITRLANVRERDEREQYITGQASRTTFISTLSLLIFLLFFSVFSLNVYRVPESQAINGKTGTVSIGLAFDLWDKAEVVTSSETKAIFESHDIPLSKSAILLILIFWQVVVFNWSAKKENLRV